MYLPCGMHKTGKTIVGKLSEETLFGRYDKVAIAIERIRAHCPPEGYIVAFSGGKDSCVCVDLCLRAGVPFRKVYSVTQVDPPELVRFILHQHPDTELKRPKRSMVEAVRSHGLPTRWRRWCCEEFKHGRNEAGTYVVGVRWAESNRRKGKWSIFQACGNIGVNTLAPIIEWSDADVWAYIRERELPYCSLYNEGHARLGCVMCPLIDRMEQDLRRWPYQAGVWRRGAEARFEYILARDGPNTRYKTADDLWQWWISGGPGRDDQGGMNFGELE